MTGTDWQAHAQEALELAAHCDRQAQAATERAEKAEAAVARVRALCGAMTRLGHGEAPVEAILRNLEEGM